MSPGLKRAREPYRLQNAITGLTLAAVGVGIWAYSISAVKQDVFDDVDEEARALVASRSEGMKNLEDGRKSSPTLNTPPPVLAATASQSSAGSPRGLLVKLLDGSFPWLLDPTRKTLIWGAPPVSDDTCWCVHVSLYGSFLHIFFVKELSINKSTTRNGSCFETVRLLCRQC